MKKRTIHFIVDIPLFAIFLIVGLTGILLFPGFLQLFGFNINSLPKFQIYQIHNWVGLLLIIIASLHIDLNWKWIITITKRLRKKNEKVSNKNILYYIVNIPIFVSFILVFITGIIKFPGFLPFLGLSPIIVPLNEISFIHDWAGVTAVIFSFVHIALYFWRMVSTRNSKKKSK